MEDNRRTLLFVPQHLHNPDDEIRASRRAVTAQNTILTLDLGFAVLKIDAVFFSTEAIEPLSGTIKFHRTVFRDLDHLAKV